MKRTTNILLISLILIGFSSCWIDHSIASKSQYKRSSGNVKSAKKNTKEESNEVDVLLEKQQKNKDKKDKHTRAMRNEEIKQAQKDLKNNKDKEKRKKINDGRFRFY